MPGTLTINWRLDFTKYKMLAKLKFPMEVYYLLATVIILFILDTKHYFSYLHFDSYLLCTQTYFVVVVVS